MVRLLLACALALGLAGGAHALTAEQARAIAAGDSTEARIAALNQAVRTADARTAACPASCDTTSSSTARSAAVLCLSLWT